jgi:hypothetical protein
MIHTVIYLTVTGVTLNKCMYTITPNALDPDYALHLYTEYSGATEDHPDWLKWNRPMFNTDRDRKGSDSSEWIELFELPTDQFRAHSGYSISDQFDLPQGRTKTFINKYREGASLHWHTDKLGDRACVIFLNPEWTPAQGGQFQYENAYWPKHQSKQRKVLMDETFYQPSSDADIKTINSDFNTAVHNANSECGILHRTTPVVGSKHRLSLLIVVSDTIYHNAYHNVGY